MGQLDDTRFDALVQRGCPACGAAALEISTFLDRRLEIMLGEPNNDGRWVHDGEKFLDGIYQVACASCGHTVFRDDACPRCHAAGGLARALGEATRVTVPKRCAACDENQLLALALIAATVRYSGGNAPPPRPRGELGDPGYHVVAYACESCDAAVVTQVCPLCAGPGPLRARP